LSYYADRVAVITGAGSGIGRALAFGLARRGAHLALSDRDGEAADDTARQCRRAGGQARADMIDVTDRRAVLDHAAGVSGDFGRVDMAFCVAGIIHTGSLLASEFSDIELVINTNLVGVINTAKAYLPHVIASGDGHIVTVSSGFGLVGIPHYSAYCATKFAVRGFSESLRQEMELDGHPVSVTCVVPGGIRTPIMSRGLFAAGEDAAAVTAMFDTKVARMEAGKAADIILRAVARRRPQVLVGADAHAVSLIARAAGSSYQAIVPWLGRRMQRTRRER
jgi:short-subunit dehydrogenase